MEYSTEVDVMFAHWCKAFAFLCSIARRVHVNVARCSLLAVGSTMKLDIHLAT